MFCAFSLALKLRRIFFFFSFSFLKHDGTFHVCSEDKVSFIMN
jgi:hypothetical protein